MTKHYRVIAAALILISLGLAVTSAVSESLTYDEPSYMGIGTYMLKTGDTTAIVSPPPLSFFVNSIFWNFIRFDPSIWPGFTRVYAAGFQSLPLIFESGHNPDLLVFLARLPVILTLPLLGLLAFLWSKKLYGIKAGLLALLLTIFCPNLMAYARLATTDFLAALTIFAAMYSFRNYLNAPSWARLILSGIVMGMAFLTRFTAIILPVSYLLLVIVLPQTDSKVARRLTNPVEYLRTSKLLEKHQGQPRTICTLALISGSAFLVLWAGYLFEFRSLYVPLYVTNHREEYFSGVMAYLFKRQIRIPAASFFINFLHQYYHGKSGHPNFFMGETSWHGRWYYFPFTILIKTPIPTLILLCLCGFTLRKSGSPQREEEISLAVPVIILLVASSASNVNTGLRHVLPIFPFIFVWISQAATFRRSNRYYAFIILIISWYLSANIRIYPHYLEYFNEIIGGPKNGYKYLVDSNLDWGQDLKLMLHRLREKKIESARIAYFGPPLLLEYYGYENSALDCSELKEGYLVISATFLNNVYLSPDCYNWLKKYKPIDRVGYSIFIYKISG